MKGKAINNEKKLQKWSTTTATTNSTSKTKRNVKVDSTQIVLQWAAQCNHMQLKRKVRADAYFFCHCLSKNRKRTTVLLSRNSFYVEIGFESSAKAEQGKKIPLYQLRWSTWLYVWLPWFSSSEALCISVWNEQHNKSGRQMSMRIRIKSRNRAVLQ